MKKLVAVTSFLVLFMVFVLPGLLSLAIDLVPYNVQPPYSTDIKRTVYGKRFVTQEFTSQADYLSAIGVSIGNPNLHNKMEIIFELYDAQGSLVRKAILNGANIEDGDFVKFVFAPIPDSKDKNYSFTISSPSANSETVIYIFLTADVPSWITKARYQDEVFQGGLPFVTFHKPQSRFEVAKVIYQSWMAKIIP